MRFTPRIADSDARLEMEVSQEDGAKVLRGGPWEAEVTDLKTGKSYLVRGAPCPLPTCFCDAVIVREIEAIRH